MIDLHAHILPGLDDGVETVDVARELARVAAADGVTAIAATPHVRDDYPTTPAQMEGAVAELRADFAREGVPVQVLTGGELAFDRVQLLAEEDLRRFTLAGNGRHLLVESPYFDWGVAVEAVTSSVLSLGLVPVIAHPERNPRVQDRPERLRPLVEEGALVQVTAASLEGMLGRSAAKAARRLVELELVHLIASDAHAPSVRQAGLSAAAATVGDDALGRWLTVDVPEAIVAAGEPPPRPARRRRRFRFG